MNAQKISCVANGLGCIPKVIALLSEAMLLLTKDITRETGVSSNTLNHLLCAVWDTVRKTKEELAAFQRLWRLMENRPLGEICLDAFRRLQLVKSRLESLIELVNECWMSYNNVLEDLQEPWCENDIQIKELELKICVLNQDALYLIKRLQKCDCYTDDTFLSVNFTGFVLWHEVDSIITCLSELLCMEDVIRIVSVLHDKQYVSYMHLSLLDDLVKSNSVFSSFLYILLKVNQVESKTSEDDVSDMNWELSSAEELVEFPRTKSYSEVIQWCTKGIQLCDLILQSVRDEDFLPYCTDTIISRVTEVKDAVLEFRINVQTYIMQRLSSLAELSSPGPTRNVFAIVREQISAALSEQSVQKIVNEKVIKMNEEAFRQRKCNLDDVMKLDKELHDLKLHRISLSESKGTVERILALLDSVREHCAAMESIIDAMPMMELPPPIPAKGKNKEVSYSLDASQMDSHVKPTQELCGIVCDILDEYILGKLMFSWMRLWMFADSDSATFTGGGVNVTQKGNNPSALQNLRTVCDEVQQSVVISAEEIKARMTRSPRARNSVLDMWGVQLRHVDKKACCLVFDSDYDMVTSTRRVSRVSIDLK